MGPHDPSQEEAPSGPDRSLVLVVARSRVNGVVVAKIAERCGLHAVCEPPERAARLLETTTPGTVILDGGPDNHDCDALTAQLLSMRMHEGLPAVILLSTRKLDEADLVPLNAIDAVVAKPILPEMLQPVVARLSGRDIG